tara:strand:- start:224 stop:430 length:207 start_codon:yes stop_codon:yes gene_type:complete
MIKANEPDRKNLNDNAPNGGAWLTITLAEVKAEDHIRANTKPRIKALGFKFPPKIKNLKTIPKNAKGR